MHAQRMRHVLLHGLFDRGVQEVRGVQDLHEGLVEAVRLLRVGGVDGNPLQFVQGLGQQGLRLQEREVVLERGLDLVAQQGLVVRGALRGAERSRGVGGLHGGHGGRWMENPSCPARGRL